MLQGQAPELCCGNIDVLIYIARTDRGKAATAFHGCRRDAAYWSGRGRKRPEVARGHRCIEYGDGGIVGHVLHDVESHVAKITCVSDAIAAADHRLTTSKNVVSEAQARRSGAPARLPQFADRAIRNGLNSAGPDLLEDVGAG